MHDTYMYTSKHFLVIAIIMLLLHTHTPTLTHPHTHTLTLIHTETQVLIVGSPEPHLPDLSLSGKLLPRGESDRRLEDEGGRSGLCGTNQVSNGGGMYSVWCGC